LSINNHRLPCCEIVTIGSELLLGQIEDTNSTFLARELASIGVDVRFRTAVGDQAEEMAEVLKRALERCDLVVTTGGLGPTKDDLTRQVVATVAGVELEFRQELMEQIEEVFRRYGYRMPETNRSQAFVPKGSEAIENPVGTAPGFIKEVKGRPIICLPGVPKELKYLWQNAVGPWIRGRFGLEGHLVASRVLKVAGIGESKVDTIIGDLIRHSENPKIGLLASPGEIKIRITAEAKDSGQARSLIQPIEQEIRSRLGNKVFGVDDDTLEGVVDFLLGQHNLSLTILETFTAGMVAQRLHAIPCHAIEKSLVIPHKEGISKDFGKGLEVPSLEVTLELARRLMPAGQDGVGLAVVGFPRREAEVFFVDACAAAVGEGVEKAYSWHMGGDLTTVQQRGSVIGLNTLRLALVDLGCSK